MRRRRFGRRPFRSFRGRRGLGRRRMSGRRGGLRRRIGYRM